MKECTLLIRINSVHGRSKRTRAVPSVLPFSMVAIGLSSHCQSLSHPLFVAVLPSCVIQRRTKVRVCWNAIPAVCPLRNKSRVVPATPLLWVLTSTVHWFVYATVCWMCGMWIVVVVGFCCVLLFYLTVHSFLIPVALINAILPNENALCKVHFKFVFFYLCHSPRSLEPTTTMDNKTTIDKSNSIIPLPCLSMWIV